MTALHPGPFLTLGLFPTARGFGWAAFSGPFSCVESALFEFGLVTVHRDKNAVCLAQLRGLLDRLEPETLVLEAFDEQTSRRHGRIRALCAAIVETVRARRIRCAIFTRGQVCAAFAGAGARTRDEVAAAVARSVPALALKLPKRRSTWDSEDKKIAIFNAAALVLTHYHFGSMGLFDDLSRGG